MARQQSTQQQSAPVPEQVQTNTADLDPLGNAQRTEDAGLGGQGTAPDDMGLLGPLASVILDAMPLPMALMTAKGAIESPHVQGWVRSLDFLDVAKLVLANGY